MTRSSKTATRERSQGLTFEKLMSVSRVSDPRVSPDGRQVVFVTATPDVPENKIRRTVHRLVLQDRRSVELTPGPGNHSKPTWSPDGRWIAFVSDRGDEGEQLWILPTAGGEARKITSGYGGVGQPEWAPDSKRIAFSRRTVVSNDYQPKRDAKVDPKSGPTAAEVFGLSHPKATAQVADELLFRHWDTWRDRRRHHIFVADIQTGKIVDLTPHDADAPPISLGSDVDYAWSPGGDEIAFVMNPDEVVAISTNNSIFVQRITGLRPMGEARCISTSDACDVHPRYTADGRSIVYLAMDTPGYEADRFRVKIYDRSSGGTTVHLESFDRSPSSFEFAGDAPNEALVMVAEDLGHRSLYRLDLTSGKVRQLTAGVFHGAFRTIPGSSDLIATRERTTHPADLYLVKPTGGIAPRTRVGETATLSPPDAGATAERLTKFGTVISGVEMNDVEEFWFAGAGGTPVHGFLTKPAGFKANRRYPLILLIHGGPQAAFSDNFHYRWSSQVFASQGAVVAKINPRGSIGYGQKFTDQISADWGGRCYEDIMRGVDHLLATHTFLDGQRMAAAGASFGGFMVNWIAGHTDRFKALVSHDGVFFTETMAYTTEELWFDVYEHGGFPHENRKPFLEFSPHLFIENFRTPTLVIHGGLDYRCPLSEGLGLFTAMQVRGVPSRFVHFPDEGHWVMKVANAQVWYEEVLGWIMKYIGK